MSFVANPHFIDAILALVLMEAIGVVGYRVLTGAGPAPIAFLCNLAAGASLLLALRAALSGATALAIAFCLALGLVAHLADLALRWKADQPTIGKQTAIDQARPNAAPSAPGRGSSVRA